MIRRILRTDVCAIAREAKRSVVKAIEANVYLSVDRTGGCLILGPGPGIVGCGFEVNGDPDSWTSHAHILTIGRVTLAAWGGRTIMIRSPFLSAIASRLDGYTWSALDALEKRICSLRVSTCDRLNRISFALDRDEIDCPGCDAPGGAHVDCDHPRAGRMTRTERAEAFGEERPS